MLHHTSMPAITAGADQDEILCGVLAAIGQPPGSYPYLCHWHGLVFFSHRIIGTLLHEYAM